MTITIFKELEKEKVEQWKLENEGSSDLSTQDQPQLVVQQFSMDSGVSRIWRREVLGWSRAKFLATPPKTLTTPSFTRSWR